jgi:hypothetical protein
MSAHCQARLTTEKALIAPCSSSQLRYLPFSVHRKISTCSRQRWETFCRARRPFRG